MELAHAGFRHHGDIVGQVVAIAGIMETQFFFWSLFPVLDPWITEMCALLDTEPFFPNAEMEVRAYGSLLMATHHRAPRNPWLSRIVERIRALLERNLAMIAKCALHACCLVGHRQGRIFLSDIGW